MHAFATKLGLALAFSALSLSAFASTHDGSCTSEPKSNWMTQDAVKAHFQQKGYTVGRVKASGTCYEVYTKAKDSSKLELFVNPADASIVGQAGKK